MGYNFPMDFSATTSILQKFCHQINPSNTFLSQISSSKILFIITLALHNGQYEDILDLPMYSHP